MIKTGNQIAAARVLIGWTQQDLANASGLHRRSIQYWEQEEVIPHGGYREPVAVRQIHKALEAAGVVLFTSPTVGVRLAQQRGAKATLKGATPVQGPAAEV